MAIEPNRPDDPDNVVSLREARARQADAKAKANKIASGQATPQKKMPVLLIFLGMLAILVAYKFLSG